MPKDLNLFSETVNFAGSLNRTLDYTVIYISEKGNYFMLLGTVTVHIVENS